MWMNLYRACQRDLEWAIWVLIYFDFCSFLFFLYSQFYELLQSSKSMKYVFSSGNWVFYSLDAKEDHFRILLEYVFFLSLGVSILKQIWILNKTTNLELVELLSLKLAQTDK